MKTVIKLLVAGAAIAVAITMTSCSTTKGFGRDLQNLGSEIEDEANEHL
jgi:predicted small secreted protein